MGQHDFLRGTTFLFIKLGLINVGSTLRHMAMGQNPVPPVNIPVPTKIVSKMGGHLSQNGTIGFDQQPLK